MPLSQRIIIFCLLVILIVLCFFVCSVPTLWSLQLLRSLRRLCNSLLHFFWFSILLPLLSFCCKKLKEILKKIISVVKIGNTDIKTVSKGEIIALSAHMVIACATIYVARQATDYEILSALFALFLKTESAPARICSDQAGVFLSVYATIFMIHAALWALLSNISTFEYAGINFGDFCLNIEPRLYKQKRIALIALALLFFDCVCYPVGWYTVMEALLFSEFIFIAVSIVFVYNAFIPDVYIYQKKIRAFSKELQLTK